jgi:uncharacterized membrane protein
MIKSGARTLSHGLVRGLYWAWEALMLYFWLIPILVLLLLALWALYVGTRRRARGRSDGRTILDKGPPDKGPMFGGN